MSDLAATERALADEREHMAKRLRGVRLIGAALWVCGVVFADRSHASELKANIPGPLIYLGLAAGAVALAALAKGRPKPWALWVVPLVDVPVVLFIEYGRVMKPENGLANAMYALGLFAFMVVMAMMT